jgi:hypothetical protein
MFVNTKMDDGPCELVHSQDLKEKFEKDNDPFKYDSLIERDFLTRISDIDRSIKRARSRVEDEKSEESSNDPNSNGEILRIQADVEKYTADAEAAGEVGEIDQAQELMLRVESLQAAKEEIVVSLYAYMYISVYIFLHAYICILFMLVCAYIYVFMHTYIYVFIYIFTCINKNLLSILLYYRSFCV